MNEAKAGRPSVGARAAVIGIQVIYREAMEPLVGAIEAMEQAGYSFPISGPSLRDDPLYDVINAAKELVDWQRSNGA